MKDNLCDISVVLDRSGSMSSVRGDTIGGFNSFLKDQQSQPGDCNFSLIQFDHEYQAVHSGKSIKDVPPLSTETFVPRGKTALLDAIGRTINDTGARLSKLPESDRPGKVLFVIITDGHENHSQEFTRAKVMEMIEHQRKTYRWQFIYLGANQDAIAVATSMGISGMSTMDFAATPQGIRGQTANLCANVTRYRSGVTLDAAFTADEYAVQAKANEH